MQMVNTVYGKIKGIEKKDYSVFLGIPYAKPPVGELRWKAPQTPESWEGCLEATSFPNRSMQSTEKDGGFYDKEFYDEEIYETPVSEDCLYLNIWTPAKSSGEKLPVAFWIHGGAFTGGYGHEKEFDGEAYCKRDTILVTINYRLGVWGFFAHPWLTDENEHHVSGNYGILDQIAALQWVRENIEAFGGDAENITVFGQSAGCISVETLVASKLTGDMISKAILQSGLGLEYRKTLQEAEADGKLIEEFASVNSLAELRKMPAEEIMLAEKKFLEKSYEESPNLPFVPIVDGYVLETDHTSLLKDGEWKDIPYLAGYNANEYGESPESATQGEYGIIHKACIEFARQTEELGRKAPYLYYFSRQLPGDNAGAFHSSELWYMFGTLKHSWRPFTEADVKLSEKMLDCWTAFMKTGSPSIGIPIARKLSTWERYSSQNPYVKELDVE